MGPLRATALSIMVLGVLAWWPAGAGGQVRWNVEGRGGLSVPSGSLSDQADPGAAFGLGLGLWAWPKLGVRADATWERFGEAEPSGAGSPVDTETARFLVGLELHLLEPGLFPVSAIVSGQAGLTRVRARSGAGGIDLEDDAFTLGGGLAVGYDLIVGLNVFVKGEAHVVFAEGVSIQSDTAPGGQPVDIDLFGTMVSFPVTAGIRLDVFSR